MFSINPSALSFITLLEIVFSSTHGACRRKILCNKTYGLEVSGDAYEGLEKVYTPMHGSIREVLRKCLFVQE